MMDRRSVRLAFLAVVLILAPMRLLAQTGGGSSPQSPPASPGVPSLDTPMADDQTIMHVLTEQLEGRTGLSGTGLRWDGEAWIGGDVNRLWLKSEGLFRNGTTTDGDLEALYDRPIPRLRYFDAQVGVRVDLDSYPRRTWAAVGIEGVAPYFFQVAPTLYVSTDGRIAARLTGSFDLLVTQRLILQPQAELNFYGQDDPARQIGSGLSELDTGLRLRYEISRKFGPYLAYVYTGRYGNSARYARMAGESTGESQLAFGFRIWY